MIRHDYERIQFHNREARRKHAPRFPHCISCTIAFHLVVNNLPENGLTAEDAEREEVIRWFGIIVVRKAD